MSSGNMEFVSVGNHRIGYLRKGSGPPILLLHGGLSDSRVWHHQLDALSHDYTVVAWDAPGCGTSTDPPEGFKLSDYADCLAAFIEKLSLHRPHLLGLSFGGGLALAFYNRYPQIPRSLILAGAYAGWAGSLSPQEVEDRIKYGMEQSHMSPAQVAEFWLPSLFSKNVSEDVKNETRKIISDFHPEGMRTMLQAFAEADLRSALPQINCPTLLLYGEEDVRSPLYVARALHERIPKSKLVTMAEVGHMNNLEDPDNFNKAVQEFLDSVSAK